MKKVHWLIIYDIKDSRRLGRVARVMVKYATRVQKSVFEMHANSATILELRRRLIKIIDNNEDYVIYFKLCEADWQSRLKYGLGRKNEVDDSELIIF